MECAFAVLELWDVRLSVLVENYSLGQWLRVAVLRLFGGLLAENMTLSSGLSVNLLWKNLGHGCASVEGEIGMRGDFSRRVSLISNVEIGDAATIRRSRNSHSIYTQRPFIPSIPTTPASQRSIIGRRPLNSDIFARRNKLTPVPGSTIVGSAPACRRISTTS